MEGRGQDRSAIGGPLLTSTTRLLQALALLQSRRFWSGPDLAEALGVTERSVRRDVQRLRELGYPVHATGGVGGGYALGAGQDLPPLPLDDEEAIAVALGLQAVASGWVRGLEEASVRALGKLEAVLPKRLRRRLGDLQAVHASGPGAGPRVDGAALAALTQACREARLVRFDYRDRAGARRARLAEPYRLVHLQPRWYLLAWDRDRQDWRTFRVDRLGGEVALLHPFRPRPLPAEDVAAYVAAAVVPESWRYRARITVHAPHDVVARKVPAPYGQVTALDAGRCLLEVQGDDLGWMAAYLGLLDCELEVHEPAELVAAITALAGRLGRAVQTNC